VYVLAKVDNSRAKYYQALRDQDAARLEEQIQWNKEHGLFSEPRFDVKTSLKEFLDKIPKEPDWADLQEGDDAGHWKDANGLAGLPIPEGCLRVDPV
jgi:hypothetical protein